VAVFLKKHQRWISFIGASIVLVTFLLREVVREHLKDLADSLDQAQSVFSIRGQLSTTNDRLKWLQNHADFELTLKDIHRMAKTGPTFEDIKSGVDSTLEQDISAIDDLKSTLDNLDRLLRKLPAEVAPPEVAEYKTQLAQLKQQRDEMETKMQTCENAHRPETTCSQAFVNDMEKESDALDVSLFWMGVHLRKVSASVLESAEGVLRQREGWYFWANVASVLFFFFGWSLGLIGTIYHVPGAKAEER
jgi:ElaB/YqjD/DUF883 family membrane-anchored ribosome-binding protein